MEIKVKVCFKKRLLKKEKEKTEMKSSDNLEMEWEGKDKPWKTARCLGSGYKMGKLPAFSRIV